jgi:uncharacterized protein involved in response to NO
LIIAACAVLLGAYALAVTACLRVLLQSQRPEKLQQVVLVLGMCAGAVGIAIFGLGVSGSDFTLYRSARIVGINLFLLPVVLTVVYRMLPFFTSVVTEGYVLRRSRYAVHAFAGVLVVRCVAELLGGQTWKWAAEVALLLILSREIALWRFWRAPRVPLLTVLYIGVGWIWLSFLLSATESLYLLLTDAAAPPFGKASLHALTVGGFGSLLIGISTRVTLGHSGRGLATGPFASALFYLFQIVPLMRVGPEVLGFWWPTLAVQGFWSGVLWVALFGAWFLGLGQILTRPRADGRPG